MSLNKWVNLILALVVGDLFVIAPILSTRPLDFSP